MRVAMRGAGTMSRPGCIAFYILAVAVGALGQIFVNIQTQYGTIEGTKDQMGGLNITRYLGIPYAKPPVGSRRFLSPEEPDPWMDTYNATYTRPLCPHNTYGRDTPMDEDCLYMNVFVPEGENLAVMVQIYNGGPEYLYSAYYKHEVLAIAGGVIVVTFNYRLSVFGYMSTGDELAQGDAAPLDQVMALKWVKNNIELFEGDPSRITILGEGVGAKSISLHLVSPVSQGLFTRAICQRGAVRGIQLDTMEERGDTYMRMAHKLGCSTNTTREMLNCLQHMPAEEVSRAANAMPERSSEIARGAATVGGEFLPKQPDYYWDQMSTNPEYYYDLMIGFTSEEFLRPLSSLSFGKGIDSYFHSGVSLGDPLAKRSISLIMETVAKGSQPDRSNPLWWAIEDEYFPDVEDHLRVLRGLLDFGAHTVVLAPSMKLLQNHASTGQRSYLFYFDQVMPTLTNDPFASVDFTFQYTSSNPELALGAYPGPHLFYLFGQVSEDIDPDNVFYSQLGESDRQVGKAMLHAWTSFAKTGQPTYITEDGAEHPWPEYDDVGQQYLEFKYPVTENSTKSRLLPGPTSFFTRLLPTYAASLQQEVSSTPEVVDKSEGTGGAGVCEEKKQVSLVSLEAAETALFILCAVLIVLLLMAGILLMNYMVLKKEMLKSKEIAVNDNDVLETRME